MKIDKVKKLHFVNFGEEYGEETPFGDCIPDERELKEFFKEAHEEFPGYNYFEFESERNYAGRCGIFTVQWWLVGVKDED